MTFRGSLNQLWVVAAALGVRNALEDQHAGDEVAPDAPVLWAGGQCRYGDVARVAPSSITPFVKGMRRQMAEDLINFRTAPRRGDEDAIFDMIYRAHVANNWVLPEASEAEIAERLEAVRSEVLTASGRARSPKDRLRRSIGVEAFLETFLSSLAEGIPGPTEAAVRGEAVEIQVNDEWIPWDRCSHISDMETERFNRGLATHLYATLIAIERACGRIEYEEPFPCPMHLPHRSL